MGLDKLVQTVAVLVIIAASTGQLPRIINYVHKAQIQLIQESKASKWPKAMLLPSKE